MEGPFCRIKVFQDIHWESLVCSRKLGIHFLWPGDSVCIVISGDLTIEHLFNFSSQLDYKPSEQKEDSYAYMFSCSHFDIGTQSVSMIVPRLPCNQAEAEGVVGA